MKKDYLRDKADSELISLIILFPLMVGILFSIIDASIYFANRAGIQNVARDAARSVAIMGGDGTATQGTPIEAKYGLSRSDVCNGLESRENVSEAYNDQLSAIECNMLKTLSENRGLVNVYIESVSCSPDKTTAISERVSCAVRWRYDSIPGSGLTLIKSRDEQGRIDMGTSGFVGKNITVGTAESEVNMTGIFLVPRS